MSLRKQLPGLDLVRFMTACAVMFYHLCYWRNGHIPAESDTFRNMWQCAWLGVQIFFVISGFVIAFSAETTTPRRFALSRALRILPTVWICATLTLFGKALGGGEGYSDLLLRYFSSLIVKPFGIHIDVVYWTLTIEVAFYGFVFLALRLFGFRKLVTIIFGLGLASVAYNVAAYFAQANLYNTGALMRGVFSMSRTRLPQMLLLTHGCFFALGVLLWSRGTQHEPRGFSFLFGAFVTGTFFQVAYSIGPNLTRFFVPWGLGLAFLIWACSEQASHLLHFASANLRTLGLMTFPLYLVHNELGLLIQTWLTSQTGLPWLAIALTMTLALLEALVICLYLEPRVAAWFRGILKRVDYVFRSNPVTSRAWYKLFEQPAL